MLKKILVVEDNEDNRRILVYRLRTIGKFDIREAANGQQAIDAVRADLRGLSAGAVSRTLPRALRSGAQPAQQSTSARCALRAPGTRAERASTLGLACPLRPGNGLYAPLTSCGFQGRTSAS